MEYIEELRDAIRRLHGVEAKHVGSEQVKETFGGQLVWEGIVEIFDIVGHATATRVYAWAHNVRTSEGDKRRQLTVLHIPPVVSAVDAVRAVIVQEFRSLEPAE